MKMIKLYSKEIEEIIHDKSFPLSSHTRRHEIHFMSSFTHQYNSHNSQQQRNNENKNKKKEKKEKE